MNPEQVAAELAKPISAELLGSGIPARLAYVGLDGGPRVVPIAFLWDGSQILVFTLPKSAKVKALQANPKVAITIDTEAFPPRVLLVRGTATMDPVDGVQDGYVEASRKLVPPDQMAAWEAGVRSLYEEMVRVTIEPEWAKLLDFETTIPKAVEDLVRARQG
jgi:nitroimidazol reductase NimA-like FMN-containing flavoprotein (pyridoxamine 5'-phosphate oxidase superfamily)